LSLEKSIKGTLEPCLPPSLMDTLRIVLASLEESVGLRWGEGLFGLEQASAEAEGGEANEREEVEAVGEEELFRVEFELLSGGCCLLGCDVLCPNSSSARLMAAADWDESSTPSRGLVMADCCACVTDNLESPPLPPPSPPALPSALKDWVARRHAFIMAFEEDEASSCVRPQHMFASSKQGDPRPLGLMPCLGKQAGRQAGRQRRRGIGRKRERERGGTETRRGLTKRGKEFSLVCKKRVQKLLSHDLSHDVDVLID